MNIIPSSPRCTRSLGKIIIVDDNPSDAACRSAWWVDSYGYAVTKIRGRSVYMHRVVAGASPGDIVDHINGDRLDNRSSNLRICTRAQNNLNNRGWKNKPSGLPAGVYGQSNGRFFAQIQVNGRAKRIGTYATVDEARAAYVKLSLELFGDYSPCKGATA